MKKLIGIGLHIYIEIIQYCMKDRREKHFEVVHNNVCDHELVAKLEEYMKYGTSFTKNKVVITSKNLLERCNCYAKYKMKKWLGLQLPGVLLYILRTCTYILNAQWIVPCTCRRMDSI